MLTQYLTRHFGVHRVEEITIGVHTGKIGDNDLTGLAPILLRAADEGDQVAQSAVNRLGDEMRVMAVTAMRPLGLTALATPVVLGGGVTARNPRLMTSITRQLAEATAQAVVRVIDVPPVVGAALLGLDHVRPGRCQDPAPRHSARLG